jgi:RNA polymerase sigma-70 factor (ECF subfamily)
MVVIGEAQVRTAAVAGETPDTVSCPEDLALARRAVDREEAAWREIYDRTRGRLFALLVYHTGRREEALELLQETYLCALKSLPRYRGDGTLAAWFAVIAIRRAHDWKRRLLRGRRRDTALAKRQQDDPPATVDELTRHGLHQALSRLGGRQRAVFLLREMEGMSFREIGAALGCSEATARVHFFRARKTMQNLLESDGVTPKTADTPAREGVASGDATGGDSKSGEAMP